MKEHGRILISDLRYGARMLASAPGFTVAALLAIALGIGATTAVFSLVNAVLIRSLPYGNAGRLVYLWTPNSSFRGSMVPQELGPNSPDFYEWQQRSHSFSSLAMLDQRMFNLVTGTGVQRVGGALVTGDFFRTLEARTAIGRAINSDDDQPGHARVVVISDALWRRNFAADPHVIGKTLQLNRQKYTVIGVMPKEFGYPFEGDVPYGMADFGNTELWAPLALSAREKTDRVNFTSTEATIGRLRPGVSAGQAQAELKTIESGLNSLYPPEWRGWTALVRPLVETIVGPVREMLWLLLGAVAMVLLIACSNVANLLLARQTVRANEMGIRAALGAERRRLVRQMITESFLLACGGGALGIMLAFAAVRAVVLINPGNIPRFGETSVDGRVLLVTVAISLITGLLFGIAPAMAGSRVNLSEFLKQGGNRGTAGTRNGWRHALIVTEVALSVVLLAGAGLLIRSYFRLQAVDLGFSPSTLTMRLALDERYNTPERRTAFFRSFLEQIRNTPGALASGATDYIPLDHQESVGFVDIKGLGKPKELVDARSATPGYFNALGMHLLAGRAFNEHDINSGNPVAIVNESFAKTYLRSGDPLTRQIRMGMGDFAGVPWSTVIGIVSDLRHSSLEENPRPEVFHPYWPGLNNDARFAIQASIPSRQLISALRTLLHRIDPALAFEDVRTMNQRVARAGARRRFETVLLSVFAALAVFLALVGLYGLLSYAVRQRTAEIGLRMALGASRERVLTMILRQGVGLVLAGLVVGLGAALALTRLVSSWLYGVRATDPVTFLAVPLFLLAVACCACLTPAIQATRVDPARTLHHQ